MSTRTRTLVIGSAFIVVLGGGILAATTFLGSSSAPSASGSPSATQTSSPWASPTSRVELEQTIRRAYLHAWAVHADAVRRLDTSHLSQALTGRALSATIAQVNRLRAHHTPLGLTEVHKTTIVIIDAVTASVDDQYIDEDVTLDPRTLRPIGPRAHKRVRMSFTLRLEDGTWKIADIIGY